MPAELIGDLFASDDLGGGVDGGVEMKYIYKNGQTSVILRVKLLDSTKTDGSGLTGLTSASAGLLVSTIADNEAAATAYAQASSKIEAVTTLGTYAAPTATKCRFKEVDATNHPGVYELQFADARFAVANARSLLISISGATNLAQRDIEIQLYGVPLDMTVAVPTSNTAETVGDALIAARCQAFGKWALVGTTLSLYANDGTTVLKSFTLDSATAPTSRT